MAAVCGAKTRDGGTCKRAPVAGSKRCYLHGGRSPRGIAHPNYTTGKYSKYLPGNIKEAYEAAVTDPALLTLDHEIALVDARLISLITALDTGESAGAWERLRIEVDNILHAQRTGDNAAAATALSAIIRLVRQGGTEADQWREINNALHSRRKLVESERQRRVVMQQFVTAEQQMMLVNQLGLLVREHVTDQRALRAISEGLIRLVQHVETAPIGE